MSKITDRIKTAGKILNAGVKMLASNKKLIFFPLVSTAAWTAFVVFAALYIFAGGANGYAGPDSHRPHRHRHISITGATEKAATKDIIDTVKDGLSFTEKREPTLLRLYRTEKTKFFILILLMLLVQAFAIYINAAFFGAAIDVFHGKPLSITGSLARAYRKKWKILKWASVSFCVGGILQLFRSLVSRIPYLNKWCDSLLAKILASFAGFTWVIGTFFVIPVLVTEDIGVRDSVKRSTELLRRVWGEQITGLAAQQVFNLSYLVIFFTVTFALLLAAMRSIASFHNMYGFLGIVYLCVLSTLCFLICLWLLNMVMSIFRCALYLYAAEGAVPEYFGREDVETAWIVK